MTLGFINLKVVAWLDVKDAPKSNGSSNEESLITTCIQSTFELVHLQTSVSFLMFVLHIKLESSTSTLLDIMLYG